MTAVELAEQLRALAVEEDREKAHDRADELLLKFIDDDAVTEAFESQEMWYG